MSDNSMKKVLNGVDTVNADIRARMDAARATPRGPATRVAELKALREEIAKKKPSAGYDPQMQLQDIDHEIARLSGN